MVSSGGGQMSDKYIKKTQGFTLVELSIVIIIIGFLISGISAGQSLVKQAALNSVINDFTKFRTGILGFTARYDFGPGDFAHGYQFWGAVGGCTDTDINTGSHDGCNGNGNGDLSVDHVTQSVYEAGLMWKHLGLAGFLNGTYSGLLPVSTAELGVDVPAGPLTNSGYYAVYDSYYGLVPLQDQISFGSTVSGNVPYGAVLKPTDAKSIDLKLDDGLPANGNLASGNPGANSSGSCSNGSGSEELAGATEYALDNDNVACRMLYFYTK